MPAHMSEMHGYRASRHNSSGARRSTLLQSQGGCSLSDAAAPAPAPYPLRWLSFLAAELHLVLIMLHVSDVRAGCMVIGMSLPTACPYPCTKPATTAACTVTINLRVSQVTDVHRDALHLPVFLQAAW